jgi:hypothetical protein
MQGVQTYDPHRVVDRDADPGLIARQSAARVRLGDDTPMEHEVTVVMPPLPRRKR